MVHRTTEAGAFFPDWFVWVFAATKRGDGVTSGWEHSEPVSGSSGGSHPGAVPERVMLSVLEGPWSLPSKWPLSHRSLNAHSDTFLPNLPSFYRKQGLKLPGETQEPLRVKNFPSFPFTFRKPNLWLMLRASCWPPSPLCYIFSLEKSGLVTSALFLQRESGP